VRISDNSLAWRGKRVSLAILRVESLVFLRGVRQVRTFAANSLMPYDYCKLTDPPITGNDPDDRATRLQPLHQLVHLVT
jgi:hypothetical protein